MSHEEQDNLDDTTDANASDGPQFIYQLYPSTVFASTTCSLLLLISNPLFGQSVLVQSGSDVDNLGANKELLDSSQDEIDVSIPSGDGAGALTTATDLMNITCTSLDPNWSCTPIDGSSGRYFKIYPLNQTTLQPGDSIQIQFNTVKVNGAAPGGPIVQISENIGGQQAMVDVNMIKSTQQLGITAWSLPSTVGLTQPSTMNWLAFGGAYVILNPGNQKFPWQGTGAFSGSTQVVAAAPQTPYTLTVWTVSGQSKKDLEVVYVSSPVVQFSASTSDPIDIKDEVTLSWRVLYATAVFLSPSKGSGQVAPAGSRTVTPGTFLAPNQRSVTYSLLTEGYQSPPASDIIIHFKPAAILYFRYMQMDSGGNLSGMAYLAENSQEASVTPIGTNLFMLKVTGPGGPLVQYLGPGPYLEIMYFNAAPAAISPGAKSTLSWVTQNATSLTLDPGGISVPLGTDGKGSYDVSPSVTTDYILTAKNASGTVTSQLTVVVNKSTV